MTRHAPVLGSAFGPVDAITFDWAVTMPVVDLAELVTTRSYYLNATEQKQQQIRDQVTAFIAAQVPDASTVDLPYRTHCFRAAVVQ